MVCLPHARGGVSKRLSAAILGELSSPRTWGCFFSFTARSLCRNVFPTHVGVFPPRRLWSLTVFGLPHARGGVSYSEIVMAAIDVSSPRTWGCFSRLYRVFVWSIVFPTHVGVFLLWTDGEAHSLRLPHARGGVSET